MNESCRLSELADLGVPGQGGSQVEPGEVEEAGRQGIEGGLAQAESGGLLAEFAGGEGEGREQGTVRLEGGQEKGVGAGKVVVRKVQLTEGGGGGEVVRDEGII